MALVGIVHTTTYEEVYPALRRVIDLAGGIELQGEYSVAIKINLCDARTPETGAITHPLFLEALLRYLRGGYEHLDIYVVESDATVVLADEFIRWFGFLPILERWNARWWNLSKDEIVQKEIDGYHLKRVPVPALLTRAHLISLSKLKTNELGHITTSLKNQFGCLPMIQKSVFHDHLAEVISDVNQAMRPKFSIVDGIIAMGGYAGPAYGVPIRAGVILAGQDPVAVASASAEFMGFKPSRVPQVRLAAAAGVGSRQYRLVGDKVDRPDFERDRLAELQGALIRKVRKLQRQVFRTSWKESK
jgi:uncharacterized protein (DUF362 family)